MDQYQARRLADAITRVSHAIWGLVAVGVVFAAIAVYWQVRAWEAERKFRQQMDQAGKSFERLSRD